MSSDYAVIEMGMSSKGEISKLVSYTQPDIAIVTNVYPMHIEFFDSLEGIAEAKAEIFEGLPADGSGTAIINEDTNFAEILEKRALERPAKLVKFGRNNIVSRSEKNGVTTIQALIGGEKVSLS